jgi:ATP-dependent RNA helicase DeaD
LQNFQELKLHKELDLVLAKINFTVPTPIQSKAIPFILNQRDVLGSAHTGTGKTAAFCIPLIHLILNNKCKQAIILAPTRELAKQIESVVQNLTPKKSPVKSLSLVGGEPIGKQLSRLRSKPQIIIGTPGRVNDHLNKKSLDLSKTSFLVLDEMDRMLDMGFSVQIDKILKFVPKEKQTLMFSATISKSIEKLSAKYLQSPERVTVEENKADVPKIEQKMIQLNNEEKFPYLVKHIESQHGLMLVFVKTKRGAKKLAKALHQEGFESDAIHGDLRQNKRTAVIKKFRANKIQILVATDVAARGLDIPNIEHVINYDLPQQAEDFIHRIGRTGRAGAKGMAWSYVTKSDGRQWREIEKILYPGRKTTFQQSQNRSNDRSKPRSRSKSNQRSFSKSKRPFDKRSNSRDNFSKGRSKSFSDRSKSSNEGSKPFNKETRSFNKDSKSFNKGSKPFNKDSKSFSKGSKPFRKDDQNQDRNRGRKFGKKSKFSKFKSKGSGKTFGKNQRFKSKKSFN